MRVTAEAMNSLSEAVEEMRARVERMLEGQQEAIEREELKDNPKEEKVAELQSVAEVLQEVMNQLDSAHDTIQQAASTEGEEE